MTQYILIALILVAALGYVARQVYRAFSHGGDPCHGCSGCTMHQQLKDRKDKTCQEKTLNKKEKIVQHF